MLKYVSNFFSLILLISVSNHAQAMVKVLKTKQQIIPALKTFGATLVKHKYKTGAGVAAICAAVAAHDYYKAAKVVQRSKIKLQKQLDTLISARDEMFAQFKEKGLYDALAAYGENTESAQFSGGIRFAQDLKRFGLCSNPVAEELQSLRRIIESFGQHNGGLIVLVKPLEDYLKQLNVRLERLRQIFDVLSIDKSVMERNDHNFFSSYNSPEFIGKDSCAKDALVEAGKAFLLASLETTNMNDRLRSHHEKAVHDIHDIATLRDQFSLLIGCDLPK